MGGPESGVFLITEVLLVFKGCWVELFRLEVKFFRLSLRL